LQCRALLQTSIPAQ